MSKKTGKQATIDGLVSLGYRRDMSARSMKYQTYVRVDSPVKFLIGKSGAIRKTRTTVADSISISGTKVHEALKHVGQASESLTSVDQAWRMFHDFLAGDKASKAV